MTALFLYTEKMKERFWKAYYYVMWSLVFFGFFIILDADNSNWRYFFSYGDQELGQYVMLSAIPMTIIRYVAIGKHFWNKP